MLMAIGVVADGSPQLHMKDSRGTERLLIGVNYKTGVPKIIFADQHLQDRIQLYTRGDGNDPLIRLVNAKGNVIWQAPK